MALPAQSDFPVKGEQLHNWLRTSFLPALVNDLSGNQILKDLRSVGGEIRTQTFFDIRREVLGIQKYQEAVTKTPQSAHIPKAFMVTDHGLALSQNLQYRFEVTGTSPITGETLNWNYSLAAQNRLIKSDAEDIIRSLITGNEEFYGILIDEVNLINVLANPSWYTDNEKTT